MADGVTWVIKSCERGWPTWLSHTSYTWLCHTSTERAVERTKFKERNLNTEKATLGVLRRVRSCKFFKFCFVCYWSMLVSYWLVIESNHLIWIHLKPIFGSTCYHSWAIQKTIRAVNCQVTPFTRWYLCLCLSGRSQLGTINEMREQTCIIKPSITLKVTAKASARVQPFLCGDLIG